MKNHENKRKEIYQSTNLDSFNNLPAFFKIIYDQTKKMEKKIFISLHCTKFPNFYRIYISKRIYVVKQKRNGEFLYLFILRVGIMCGLR